MRRFAFPVAALAVLPLAITGCVGERTLQRTLPATPTPGVSATAMASTPSLAEPVAVPAGAPLVLGMAECVQRALRDNRGFRTKLGERIVAELATTIARSQVYAPRLAASYTESNQSGEDHGAASVTAATPLLGFTITPFVRDDFDPANVDTGDSHVSSYGVTLSHSLLNLHDHVAQRLPVNRADMNLMKAANNLLLEAKRVELETTRAFLRAQNAMASTKVRERRVADAEQFLASVRENVRNGFKAPLEELNAGINLNQAQADLARDQTSMSDALERLLLLLALPVSTRFELQAEDVAGVVIRPPGLDADLERLLGGHESLAVIDADVAIARRELLAAEDQRLPQIDAGLTAEERRIGDEPFDDGAERDQVLSLTVTLAMPLDLWRAERARVAQLRRQIADRALTRADTAAGLEQQLRSVHRRIQQLLLTVDLAIRRLEAERGKLEATLSKYQAGAVDNLEVTRSKQDLDQAEITLLDTRIQLVLAAAEYRSLLPSPLVTPGGVGR